VDTENKTSPPNQMVLCLATQCQGLVEGVGAAGMDGVTRADPKWISEAGAKEGNGWVQFSYLSPSSHP
jgi:hypothetical protein